MTSPLNPVNFGSMNELWTVNEKEETTFKGAKIIFNSDGVVTGFRFKGKKVSIKKQLANSSDKLTAPSQEFVQDTILIYIALRNALGQEAANKNSSLKGAGRSMRKFDIDISREKIVLVNSKHNEESNIQKLSPSKGWVDYKAKFFEEGYKRDGTKFNESADTDLEWDSTFSEEPTAITPSSRASDNDVSSSEDDFDSISDVHLFEDSESPELYRSPYSMENYDSGKLNKMVQPLSSYWNLGVPDNEYGADDEEESSEPEALPPLSNLKSNEGSDNNEELNAESGNSLGDTDHSVSPDDAASKLSDPSKHVEQVSLSGSQRLDEGLVSHNTTSHSGPQGEEKTEAAVKQPTANVNDKSINDHNSTLGGEPDPTAQADSPVFNSLNSGLGATEGQQHKDEISNHGTNRNKEPLVGDSGPQTEAASQSQEVQDSESDAIQKQDSSDELDNSPLNKEEDTTIGERDDADSTLEEGSFQETYPYSNKEMLGDSTVGRKSDENTSAFKSLSEEDVNIGARDAPDEKEESAPLTNAVPETASEDRKTSDESPSNITAGNALDEQPADEKEGEDSSVTQHVPDTDKTENVVKNPESTLEFRSPLVFSEKVVPNISTKYIQPSKGTDEEHTTLEESVERKPEMLGSLEEQKAEASKGDADPVVSVLGSAHEDKTGAKPASLLEPGSNHQEGYKIQNTLKTEPDSEEGKNVARVLLEEESDSEAEEVDSENSSYNKSKGLKNKSVKPESGPKSTRPSIQSPQVKRSRSHKSGSPPFNSVEWRALNTIINIRQNNKGKDSVHAKQQFNKEVQARAKRNNTTDVEAKASIIAEFYAQTRSKNRSVTAGADVRRFQEQGFITGFDTRDIIAILRNLHRN